MHALNDLMLSRFTKDIAEEIGQALKHDPNAPKHLEQTMSKIDIAEVLTYGDDFACVVCKPTVPAPERPYAISLLLKSDGKWKSNGPPLDLEDPRSARENTFATAEAAREYFDKNKDRLRKSCIEAKGKIIDGSAKFAPPNKEGAQDQRGVGNSGPQPSKRAIAAKAEPEKPGVAAGTQGLDPKIVELGKAVSKRLSAWSDEETLTLRNGQTGRMKVKKNVTPVMEILLTPHFVENGTPFDLEGVDAAGKAIEGTKYTVHPIHDGQASRMGLAKTFPVAGEPMPVLAKIQLKPTRHGDTKFRVSARASS